MDDASGKHGKEINLRHTTVKVPGQYPRGSRTQSDSQQNDQTGNNCTLVNSCQLACHRSTSAWPEIQRQWGGGGGGGC